jgi:hypothetical protein
VVGLRSWKLDPKQNRDQGLFVQEVDNPSEAIRVIKSLLR